MPDINLSPYTAESAAIARKMRLAEALQQQALSPLEMPTMAGVAISPYAGLAKMLQAYSASKMRGKAEEREKTLADTARADISADYGTLLKGMTPTAAVPEGPSTFPTLAPATTCRWLLRNAALRFVPDLCAPATGVSRQLGMAMADRDDRGRRCLPTTQLTAVLGSSTESSASRGWAEDAGAACHGPD